MTIHFKHELYPLKDVTPRNIKSILGIRSNLRNLFYKLLVDIKSRFHPHFLCRFYPRSLPLNELLMKTMSDNAHMTTQTHIILYVRENERIVKFEYESESE